MADDPLLETGRQLSHLFPRAAVCIYTRRRSGELAEMVEEFTGPLRRGWHSPQLRETLAPLRQYQLRGRDEHANRPANTAAMLRLRPDVMRRLQEGVLARFGLWHQLRVAVYSRGEFVAWCGFLGTRRDGDFAAADIRLFASVAESLCDAVVASRALSDYLPGRRELGSALDAFEEPALLVSSTGQVLFANRVAREARLAEPHWLGNVGRGAIPSAAEPFARCRPIDVDGRSCWLVLPRVAHRHDAAGPADGPGVALLPPGLRPVALLIESGLTDKEVAQETGLAHATVRTYATRIYRHLGVGGRSELRARLAASRRPPACSSAGVDPPRPAVPQQQPVAGGRSVAARGSR